MDEMPDTDEIAELERRALAAEEAHDIERLLARLGRLPSDSKLECLKDVLRGLKEAGFAQTMVFTQFTDTMDFLRTFCGRRYAARPDHERHSVKPDHERHAARPGRKRHLARPDRKRYPARLGRA